MQIPGTCAELDKAPAFNRELDFIAELLPSQPFRQLYACDWEAAPTLIRKEPLMIIAVNYMATLWCE